MIEPYLPPVPVSIQREAPAATRLVWADWWALVSAALMVLPWCLPLLSALVGHGTFNASALPLLIVIGCAGTLLGALALVFRLRRLRLFFRRGVEIVGVIETTSFFRDRGLVFFSYVFDHRRYQSSMALHETASTRLLAAGKRVRVLVDPHNPARAILPSVFEPLASVPHIKRQVA